MGSKMIEKIVAEIAATTSKLDQPIPDGKCWAFVHHVLVAANAKSFYDYKNKGDDPVFAPWGEVAVGPQQGYIVVFKDVVWRTIAVETVVRGTIKTRRTVKKRHTFHQHVAVILDVQKSGALLVAQQGVPGPDARPGVMVVPVKHLDKGEVKYYRPVAMPDGKKTSSPTPAAKAAGGPSR
jgi:hypothetical protein